MYDLYYNICGTNKYMTVHACIQHCAAALASSLLTHNFQQGFVSIYSMQRLTTSTQGAFHYFLLNIILLCMFGLYAVTRKFIVFIIKVEKVAQPEHF